MMIPSSFCPSRAVRFRMLLRPWMYTIIMIMIMITMIILTITITVNMPEGARSRANPVIR